MLKNKTAFSKVMEIPLTINELKSQNDFIEYLNDNKVKTAKILQVYKKNGKIVEIQEYIDGNHNADIKEFIKTIAIFHKISKKYSKTVKKEKVYYYNCSVRGALLNKILLGYNEKFNYYPLLNYKINKKYISIYNRLLTKYITNSYVEMYNYINAKFKNDGCIIHNDISLDNIIVKNKKIYLIDFDFCINSFEIVDIADTILTKYSDVSQIIDNPLIFKRDIIKYCNIYKSINNININYYDIMFQIAIKIISFYYYILLNNKNKKAFNKGIKKIYKLVKVIKMKVGIRKANSLDANDIIKINIESWKNTYKNIFPDEFLNSLDSKYEETVEKCVNTIDEYIVATIDGNIVGFARYGKNKKDFNDEYSEVFALYVDKDYRCNNIGKQLLKYAFDDLKNNYKYCLISTIVENRANSFYVRNNGKRIGESDFKLLDKIYKENIYRFEL